MKTLHGKLPLMSQYWTNPNEWDKIETQIIGQNWILILIFLIDDIQQDTLLKGYLHYKTLTSQNMSSKIQIKVKGQGHYKLSNFP